MSSARCAHIARIASTACNGPNGTAAAVTTRARRQHSTERRTSRGRRRLWPQTPLLGGGVMNLRGLFRAEALEHHARGARPGEPLRPGDHRGGFRRVVLRGRRRVPFVPQAEMADCGAAALAMTLAAYGKWVPLREVREVVGNGRDGATAEELVSAARHFGLRARGVQADVDELDLLPVGSILFWELNHFLVLAAVRRDGVDLVDPAVGRVRFGWARFGRSYTGVALELEPGEEFETQRLREAGAATPARRCGAVSAHPAGEGPGRVGRAADSGAGTAGSDRPRGGQGGAGTRPFAAGDGRGGDGGDGGDHADHDVAARAATAGAAHGRGSAYDRRVPGAPAGAALQLPSAPLGGGPDDAPAFQRGGPRDPDHERAVGTVGRHAGGGLPRGAGRSPRRRWACWWPGWARPRWRC